MSQTGASGHDGSLVDWHSIFGVVGNNRMTGFMIRCDLFVLTVYFCTPSLRAFRKRGKKIITFFLSWKTREAPEKLYRPMRILSFANSSSFMVTTSLPSTAAFRAAWLTRFSRSAPEKPTVPRAITFASMAAHQTKNRKL